MKRVSFCTTCKGRLWQLEQTLPNNLKILDDYSEIVLLDYQSPDGLKNYIFDNFKEELGNGRLKYYETVEDYAYSSAYAKNLVHKIATGDILFNLDADNYLYDGILYELRLLKDNQLFLPKLGVDNDGLFGRLGYTRESFMSFQGYDENIVGLGGDDGKLRLKAHSMKYYPVHASIRSSAIQNTREQKDKYVNNDTIKNYNKPSPPLNYPEQWGVGLVLDSHGNKIQVK